MTKEKALWIFVISVAFTITLSFICYFYSAKIWIFEIKPRSVNHFRKSNQQKSNFPNPLLKFNNYLGQRIAVWGTVVSGERKGVYPYVMIFGNPDLRINLWFSYSEKDENDFYKKLNIDAVKDARGFLVSVPDKRRKVYLSGVLTYGYISPDTRRGEISRDGILPRLPLTEYGEFFLDNPIALEVISEKESDTILQEIKGLELLSEDKKCIKSPYMFDATPKMYKEFLLFLQGHERISVEEQ